MKHNSRQDLFYSEELFWFELIFQETQSELGLGWKLPWEQGLGFGEYV